MKRAVVTFILALSLISGAAVAQAWGGPPQPWNGGDWGGSQQQQPATPTVALAGTITSVDAAAGTFQATVFEPQGDHRDGDGQRGQRFHSDWMQPGSGAMPAPTMTPVTVTTNGSTVFRVNGQMGSISALSQGQRFVALFDGTPGESIQSIVASPALAVFAHTAPAPKQLYAFVGKVTAVDTTSMPETVTVSVTNSFPTSLIPSGSAPATFTVSPDTIILGGPTGNGLEGGSLSNVAVGDVVAGGEIGTAGETLSQVEASPLGVLLDFPASSSTSTSGSSSSTSQATALSETLGLFGVHAKAHKHSRTKRHRRSTKHHVKRSGKSHSSLHASRK